MVILQCCFSSTQYHKGLPAVKCWCHCARGCEDVIWKTACTADRWCSKKDELKLNLLQENLLGWPRGMGNLHYRGLKAHGLFWPSNVKSRIWLLQCMVWVGRMWECTESIQAIRQWSCDNKQVREHRMKIRLLTAETFSQKSKGERTVFKMACA